MGFWEDLTIYIWNWAVWKHVETAAYTCWVASGWGLIIDDDDGLMMKNCLNLWGGLNVSFPVTFTNSYSQP